MPGAEPNTKARRNRARRRLIWLIIVVDIVVVAVVVLLFVTGAGRGPARSDGFEGSIPPAGQQLPDLTSISSDMHPTPPARDELRNAPVLLVATCIDCQSGSIFGGFLARLAEGGTPGDAAIVVLAWNGDVDAWRRQWRLPASVHVSMATSKRDTAAVQRELAVGESGVARVYDHTGTWRSTLHAGQLRLDDARHDLRRAAD